METIEKFINIESMILDDQSDLKFYVCLKNPTMAKQKRVIMEHQQLLGIFIKHCTPLETLRNRFISVPLHMKIRKLCQDVP